MEELEEDEGPTLPTNSDDEFRPFIRRLPEFKFWLGLLIQVLFNAGFHDCIYMHNV